MLVNIFPVGFQGRHQDKQQICYKKEGDGFQADCICESGYTYTFYFRNVPAPKKYLMKKCSPLHSRVLFLFDQLLHKNNVVGLDNLYISAQFCREAITGKNKVMVHGGCQKEGRRLPSCILQKECVKKVSRQQSEEQQQPLCWKETPIAEIWLPSVSMT